MATITLGWLIGTATNLADLLEVTERERDEAEVSEALTATHYALLREQGERQRTQLIEYAGEITRLRAQRAALTETTRDQCAELAYVHAALRDMERERDALIATALSP